MILSIIYFVVIAFLVLTVAHKLNGGTLTEEVEAPNGLPRRKITFLNKVSSEGYIKALAIGLAVALVNYFAPKVSGALWLAPIFMAIMVGISIYLIAWAHMDASSVGEFFVFGVIAIPLYLTTKVAAYMTASLIPATGLFWRSLILLLPLLIFIESLVFYVVDWFYFRYQNANQIYSDDDGERANRKAQICHILAWVFMIIGTAAVLVILMITRVNWSNFSFGGSNEDAVATITDAEEVSWCGFYNPSLLNDDDETNNYNFGYNYFSEEKSASDYDADLRERIKVDPALGAADMAWLDANLGTRYMGQFYDECNGAWDKAINDAKDGFIADQTGYYDTITAFFAYLDTAEVSIAYSDDKLDDQMYMNPYTTSDIPDVVVYETDDHAGWFLVYTFNIKGTKAEVAYRIDCGYQPTDVAKVMNITPQENPSKKTTPGDDPTPSPTPTPQPTPNPNPNPDPDPTPTYNKDKTQGTQGDLVAPNVNKGPGEDTNNGVGAQTSTKDQPSNSTSMTYDQYAEKTEDLKQTNESQNTGGDANTPSVTPSTGTKVDSNADEGTGDGGIDTPTITTPLAQESDGSYIDDSPAGAWGGPED